ncbi:unnamed protein product, partial [Prorocentrum cordatum]
MTQHIYNFRKMEFTSKHDDVNKLIGMIKLPDGAKGDVVGVFDGVGGDGDAGAGPTDMEALTAHQVGELFDLDIGGDEVMDADMLCISSEDEVEETGFVCRCPACTRVGQAACPTTPSSISGTPFDIPNPKRGGQKSDTLKMKPCHRLRAKTTVAEMDVNAKGTPMKGKSARAKKRARKMKKFAGALRRRKMAGNVEDDKEIDPKKKAGNGSKASSGSSADDKKEDQDMLKLPVTLAVRAASESRPGEAYIMQNSKTRRYVTGLSGSKNPNYLDIMNELMANINEGKICTR